jgi:hypothetical protein
MKNWIALAVLVVISLVGLTACGGDDDDSTDDTRASQIGALSENAVDAWAVSGASGLYAYLTQGVLAHCSTDALSTALSGQPRPTAWRNTKNFDFSSDTQGTATVIIVSGEQDIEQTWTFQLENGTWRISDMPGLSGCTST